MAVTLEEAQQYVSRESERRNGRIIPQLPPKLKALTKDPHWYIFNVSPFPLERQLGSKGMFTVPECKEGAMCSEPLAFPVLDNETIAIEMNKMANIQEDGIDTVNAFMMRGYGFQPSDSLETWGVAVINYWPPQREDIQNANKALDRKCDELIADADRSYEQRNFKEIAEIHRWAARRRKQNNKGWLNANPDLTNCPACGSAVMQNIAVCPHCSATLDEKMARKYFPERFK
jgi:hypothetical protein